MYEANFKFLELVFFELQFAFEGLADEKVWQRPVPELHSIGELAVHIAYGEASRLAGEDLTSPLIDAGFRYYPKSLEYAPTEAQRALTAAEVYAELQRIHEACLANFKALNPAPDTPIHGDPSGFTYGLFLEYLVFHVAYHTGQMYSVRHLLGDETPDN